MRGLIEKILREMLVPTLLFALGLYTVMAILTFVLPQLQGGIGSILEQLPFVRTFIGALLGTEIGDDISAQMFQAFLFVHPVVLLTTWGHAITFCTRVPAGEIDRGTVDVLLAWPLSRGKIYAVETVMCLASGLFVLATGWLGHLTTVGGMPDDMRPSGIGVIWVYLNFFALYISVAGLAFLASSISNRRGRAVGAVVAFIVASFLLNFIAPFWEPARSVDFLALLTYYRPAEVLSNVELPIADIAVLLGVALTAWSVGGLVLMRRSIATA